jgi:hypothetical protein
MKIWNILLNKRKLGDYKIGSINGQANQTCSFTPGLDVG